MDVKKRPSFLLPAKILSWKAVRFHPFFQKEKTISSSAFRWQRIRASAGKSMPPPPVPYHVLRGCMNICLPDEKVFLKEGDAYFSPAHIPFSISAAANCIFLEIGTTKEALMNKAVKYSGVFQLKDVVPCQAGKVINRELIDTEGVRFAVISLSAGTILPEHAAPNDALLFALDGEAVLTAGERITRSGQATTSLCPKAIPTIWKQNGFQIRFAPHKSRINGKAAIGSGLFYWNISFLFPHDNPLES